MNNKDLILSIDNGTQSLRALIFNLKGDLLAKERVAFKPYFSDQPGWAEQDPEIFWQSLCTACQKIWLQGIPKERIAGVSLTTQRGTVINVDSDGKPLRPAILWLDQRKTYDLPKLPKPIEIILNLLNLSDTIKFFRQEAEANWIFNYQPDIWEKTHKYLLLSGYLTYRLTGEFADSIGCQVGYVPFDYKNLKWAGDWDIKSLLLPINKNILPDLVPPGKQIGAITKIASEQTGIPEGLPLIAAAADKACEVIGSGSLEPHVGCLSYGTTATINVTHKKYIEAITLLPAYPSAIPDYHNLEVQIFRGYWMVSWFKQEFGYREQEEAVVQGIDAEALFDKLVEDVPPGSMGLILQPYWTPGIKLPGPEAKGSIIGFGDVHTKAHIYRAILEGLAYALKEGKERIESKTQIPITQLRISGGGSQSRHAMQVTADVFGLPTSRPHLYETSGLGAAIDAAVGLNFYNSFEEAVKRMTHVGDVFEPNMKNYRLYDELYTDVYKKLYKQLKPLYERIREITGYPK
ncbi:MAG: FGGY-family carbohydrate kinase [Desulfobacterales bacterium]|nr:FGGY-family carbohydrate kinase [Desulfobacterales bacterium]MBF0395531.1 FGGY-family carbohydrate kinase [Desulfobacterales bacterium]